jgi:DNA modification methylase
LTLAVEYRPVSALRTNPRNARTHSKKQIAKLADGIRRFGFTNPVLIDEAGTLIAGHGRVAAAKLLGLPEVPTLRLDHMSEAEKRAYVIADNRLAELAGWDRDLLALEFEALGELDFDLSLTGFELPEIEILLDERSDKADPEDVVPEPSAGPAVSRLGDLWLLGAHRLFCGSALEASAYATLLGEERADVLFTDPPYNVPVQGHVSGLGKSRHREFAMASGEMSEAAFTAFLRTAFEHMAAFSRDGAIHFICMDWRHMREVLTAAENLYSELKNLCVWNKDNGGMGSLYRSKHELVFVFKKGSAPHVNNVELGRFGRNRTNVWDYPGQNTFHRDRETDLAAHPTVKPTALVADALRDVSHRGTLVLDPFCGSGTTILAAEKTGRRACAIELDPAYVDVAIRRWQQLTGQAAVLAGTGQSFNEVTQRRQHEEADHA